MSNLPKPSKPTPTHASLVGLKYEEVLMILRGLDSLIGEVDDIDTLTQVDKLQKKIKGMMGMKI